MNGRRQRKDPVPSPILPPAEMGRQKVVVDARWRTEDSVSTAARDLAGIASVFLSRKQTIAADGQQQRAQLGQKEKARLDELGRSRPEGVAPAVFLKQQKAAADRLSAIKKQIQDNERQIEAIDRKRKENEGERTRLESTVAKEVGPLGLPPFWIFRWRNPDFDQQQAQISNRERELKASYQKMLEGKQALDQERASLDTRQQECRRQAEEAQREVERLATARAQAERAAREEFHRRVEEVLRKRDLGLAQAEEDLRKNWSEAMAMLEEACRVARTRQPRLDRIDAESLPTPTAVPRLLCAARRQLSFGTWEMSIPAILPFPLPGALLCDVDQIPIQDIALRMLLACPVGQVAITIVDPAGMGSAVRDLLPLLGDPSPVAQGKVLTMPGDIEAALAEELSQLEKTVQQRLSNLYEDIAAYNAANADTPIKQRVIVYAGFPAQASERSIGLLERLQAMGARAGISLLLTAAPRRDQGRPDRLAEAASLFLDQHCTRLSTVLSGDELLPLKTKGLSGDLPTGDPSSIVSTFAERWRKWSSCPVDVADLLEGVPVWGMSAQDGLKIPLGRGEDGREEIVIGMETCQHLLVGGKSGSGKSNLIHLLITSACHRYPPDQLQIALLDFKEGVEFARYSEGLPHAKVVSVETDRELGVQVLEDYMALCEERGAAFRRLGVNDYPSWCRSTGAQPRHLIIIDEFQRLFEQEDALAQRAAQLLDTLARLGRGFGVHLLLATQTLSGITNHVRSLSANLGIRIALACHQEDSNLLLNVRNNAATRLHSPPEAIINTRQGEPDGNRIIRLPHASHQVLDEQRKVQVRLARERGIASKPHVHFADRLATFPRDLPTTGRALLGERLGLGGDVALPLEDVAGKAILLVAQSAPARRGTLLALVASLVRSGKFKTSCLLTLGEEAELLRPHLNQSHADPGAFLDDLRQAQGPSLAVIGPLEMARGLGPPAIGGRRGPDQDRWDALSEFLLAPRHGGSVVVAWSASWRSLARQVDLRRHLNAFDIRIANSLPAEDCLALFGRRHGSIGVVRAAALNTGTDAIIPFKPFGLEVSTGGSENGQASEPPPIIPTREETSP